jgi:hypothetical protein
MESYDYEKEKLYKDFYKDDIYYTNINIIYINKSNDIEKIKQESFLMTMPNFISREEIMGILKDHSIVNDKRYTLLSILKYNVTLNPEDISYYLKHTDTKQNIYLEVVNNIDSISFEKTISMFHDLTELIILFFEKSIVTKKEMCNITKKIYLTNSHHKTIKKQYKAIL